LLTLGKAEGVFARIAQRCPIYTTRLAAAHIADDQLQSAANSGIGTIALP
jgi:hypothetical protein